MNAEFPSTRIVWLTDLHLNFVPRRRAEELAEEVRVARPDAVLLGGDTADAPVLAGRLSLLAGALAGTPVGFVLGNHDFYHGSFAEVTRTVRELCARNPDLRWLGGTGGLVLGGGRVTLVGADGWGDGGHGDRRTPVRLNDWTLIEELREAPDPMGLCGWLGERSAEHLRGVLRRTTTPKVIVLTHVPPFLDAAAHQGKPSDEDHAPFFVCKAVGDVLLEEASAHPEREFLVLCGHTHEAAETQVKPNLRVLTGGAEYRRPAIQRVLEL